MYQDQAAGAPSGVGDVQRGGVLLLLAQLSGERLGSQGTVGERPTRQDQRCIPRRLVEQLVGISPGGQDREFVMTQTTANGSGRDTHTHESAASPASICSNHSQRLNGSSSRACTRTGHKLWSMVSSPALPLRSRHSDRAQTALR